ncbi:uncharacterized protein TNCV_3966441 [Trichonephila clavipes]|nr:uncharacterized protein TNCV_3966441 [Trichonephila clavipes]
MSPGLASKALVGVFSFEENLEFFFNHITSVKEMHTVKALPVFGDSIFLGGRTDLHIFPRGNVNTHTYGYNILDAYGRLYAGTIGDGFVLQDDNAKLHRDRIVDDYIEQEAIQRIQWPA